METEQKRLTEILRDFRDAMFVTRGSDGELRARPMALADVERDDADLWFATTVPSGKADEVLRDPHVVVTLQSGTKFATITGTAALVRDRAAIEAKWSEAWRAWFPDGKDDPTLCLIRVSAVRGEFWDMSGTKGARYLWQAAKAYAQGKRPEIPQGSHGAAQMKH